MTNLPPSEPDPQSEFKLTLFSTLCGLVLVALFVVSIVYGVRSL